MKLRTYAIVFFVALLIVVGVALVTSSKNTKPPAAPTPTVRPSVTGPLFPEAISARSTSYVSIPREPTVVELPYYTIASRLTAEGVVALLSKQFVVQGSPQKILGAKGEYFVLQQGYTNITVSGDPISGSYVADASFSGILTGTAQAYIEKSRSLIEGLELPASPISVSSPTLRYFAPTGNDPTPVPDARRATVIQINYQYALGAVPLYVGSSSSPGVSVQYDGAGVVLSFRAIFMPALTKQD